MFLVVIIISGGLPFCIKMTAVMSCSLLFISNFGGRFFCRLNLKRGVGGVLFTDIVSTSKMKFALTKQKSI